MHCRRVDLCLARLAGGGRAVFVAALEAMQRW